MRWLKILDLSVALDDGMPYFKGDPRPEIWQYKTIDKDGYNIKEMKIGTHTGTHLDAPAHFIKGGKTVDQLDLASLRGKATCISYDPSRGVALPDRIYDIILLYTGYNNSWGKTDIFENYSYIGKDDAAKIRDYGAKLVGIDSPTVEIQDSTDFEAHHILLGSSIPIVENLNSTTLSVLVGHSFSVEVMPILVRGGDGAPARVVAIEA